MFETWIENHMEQMLEDMKGLLRIPSVSRGTPEPGKPLGKDVYAALQYAVDLAKKLGIDTGRILDGYCATIDIGEGDEMLMVQCHLDVVPAGTGWDSNPFEPVIKNGRLICRGVLDDKGAAISVLYAMAAIKEAGLKMKRRVRLFLGGDEEVGWECVDRYNKTEEQPTIGFTPDANYPLVNSEKGICQTRYHKILQGSSIRINCGTAPNVVPGEASAELSFAPVMCKVPKGYTMTIEGNTISIKGRGGHAAENHLAYNALLCLLDVLNQQPLDGEDLATVSSLSALLGYDVHGEGFGVDITDDSGRLSNAVDMMTWKEDGVEITMDCRYPFSLSFEDLTAAFDKNYEALGFTRVHTKNTPGIFTPADSELVKTLLGIYEKKIGHKSEPLAIGGGTYARGFKNTVAFGIEPEGEPSECHMPNESMSLDNIRFNTEVFAEAIKELAAE